MGGEQQAVGKNVFRNMYPEAEFDTKLAKSMLERGTGTLRGRACSKVDGGIYYAKGVKVVLYPVTPYLEAWYELREKKKKERELAYTCLKKPADTGWKLPPITKEIFSSRA